MGTISHPNMSFAPFARGYGYPAAQFGGYGGDSFGYAPYGAYGPSLEEVKKIREAEEKAFKEAEKKQCEEYCEAQKKAVDDAVEKEKEFYEKERELFKPFAHPGMYGGAHAHGAYGHGAGGFPGAYGYGAPHGAGYGAPHGAGYGAGARGYG